MYQIVNRFRTALDSVMFLTVSRCYRITGYQIQSLYLTCFENMRGCLWYITKNSCYMARDKISPPYLPIIPNCSSKFLTEVAEMGEVSQSDVDGHPLVNKEVTR